jgi:hypothetical protein
MIPNDTSPDAEALMTELYRRMSPGEKLLRVFDAYQVGKSLALAGLTMRYPGASSDQLEMLWKRQHLGDALFTEVYGKQASDQLPL